MTKVEIDSARITELARKISDIKDFPAYQFDLFPGVLFPAFDGEYVIDYFFASVLHQFGFWFGDEYGYVEPFYDYVNGKRYKGSDFIWSIFVKRIKDHTRFLDLDYRANYDYKTFNRDMAGDDKICRLPMPEEHLNLARSYAADMLCFKETPRSLIKKANNTAAPELFLLNFLKNLSGYKEDYLAKKAMLLILTLANRPEHFIKISDNANIKPIVDYHIQRTSLRTGIVKIIDRNLLIKIKERLYVPAAEEKEIRETIYSAINLLSERSGKSIAAIDFFFYNARKNCPEMTKPDCSHCKIQDICGKYIEMFQPVIRTTYY